MNNKRKYTAIISSHVNPNLSGVAKFNMKLSEYLGARFVGIDGCRKLPKAPVLLSVKVKDINGSYARGFNKFVNDIIQNELEFDLFLHTYDNLPVENKLIKKCRVVYPANAFIKEQIKKLNGSAVDVWCPALVDQDVVIHESKLNIFSFGMAHKIQVSYYRKLEKMLREFYLDYSLWISTAFHEKANFGDFDSLSNKLSGIYKDNVQFLGFLSDEAVNYFLDKTNLFVAFFEKGVRSNNTSVLAAMNRGCAILTNLDKYSPRWMEHRHNCLDINRVEPDDLDPVFLNRIGYQARLDSTKYGSWEGLIDILSQNAGKNAQIKDLYKDRGG